MTKNKVVISSVNLSVTDAYDTSSEKSEALLNEIKEYFSNDGFTAEVIYDADRYVLCVSVPEFTTRLTIAIKPGTATNAGTLYKGIEVSGKKYYYGSGQNFKFSRDASYIMIGLSYIYTGYTFGIYTNVGRNMSGFGFQNGNLICKANNSEYVRNTVGAMLKCETQESQSISVQENTYGIGCCILNKVMVLNGSLEGVYLLRLPTCGNSIDQENSNGGIYAYLDGYGRFLCTKRDPRTLWALKVD